MQEMTPLSYAVRHERMPAAKRLVEMGANFKVKDVQLVRAYFFCLPLRLRRRPHPSLPPSPQAQPLSRFPSEYKEGRRVLLPVSVSSAC
jgi:hypothetical protein